MSLPEPIIRTAGLGKDYRPGGGVVITGVTDASLSIAAGDFVVFAGPSGSGKTTLLEVLGLLSTYDRGSYLLEGKDVSRMGAWHKARFRLHHLGFVFQAFNLLPRRTVRQNVTLPLLLAGASWRQRRRRVDEVLRQVGIAERAGHLPSELSGGESQRVALARALVNHPRVIFADEPTGNLDSATTRQILALFTQLHRQGHTIVLVTHDPEVMACGQRILHLRDGRILP